MPMVRAQATMVTELEAEVFIPDDVPKEKWGEWVKQNVGGEEFYDIGCGDWTWNYPYDPKRID